MEWETELKNQLENLTETHQLEALGKTLTSPQMLYVLDYKASLTNKLSPILAGLSPEVFSQVLLLLTPEQLLVLQHESMTIPVQHHLTVLSLDKFKMLDYVAAMVLTLETLIEHLEVEKLGIADLSEIIDKIDQLSQGIDFELNILNKALSLAWNSDRADLIEKLSLLKETIQKYKTFSIGKKDSQEGLYAKLNRKLNNVYNETNWTTDRGVIPENTPAIEALAKLSIWYIQDYFAIGLLPEIQSGADLDLSPAKHSEKERFEYKENLINKVKNKLKELGLLTLEDLKKNRIYSKKGFQEYISNKSESKLPN